MDHVSTAVILAAGKSTRTYPLTLDKPKGLLKVLNKPILMHTLEELKGVVRNVFIVVGYKKELVKKMLGSSYAGISINYMEQKEISGTGAALWGLKEKLKGRFLVLNGDDLYNQEDIIRLCTYRYAVLGQHVQDPSQFGVLVTDKKHRLLRLVEKPKKMMGNLVNTGCYILDERIFEHTLQKSPRGEYEITDYLFYIAQTYGVTVVPVKRYWIALSYAWDLLKVNQYVLQHDFVPAGSKQKKSPRSTFSGPIAFGKQVKCGSHVVIQGPAVLGDHVVLGEHVRILPNTILENNVVVGDYTTIKASLVMDGSKINKESFYQQAIITPKYTLLLNKQFQL